MRQIRKNTDRGAVSMGWLETQHTFSFGEYYDPRFMGFRSLRVINEDHVAPAEGFPTHPHRDMEIVTYIIDGALEHRDSMGTGSVIREGDVQRMSAGTGVTHSEFNASKSDAVHLLQIWMIPERAGLKPEYEQKNFSPEDKHNTLRLLASHDGRDSSLTIHSDVSLYASVLDAKKTLEHPIATGRGVWVQLVSGKIRVNGDEIVSGDGIAIVDENSLRIEANENSEFLVFDLA